MKTALFPGSFDPFTRGHQAIVTEGLKIFDRIVIGIGINLQKQGLLTVENRKRLIDDLYRNDTRIETVVYEELTGELCRQRNIGFLLRGIRNATDCEYERNIMTINKMLYPELTTVLLFAPAEHSAVSSSAIREIMKFGGDVSTLMPEDADINKYI